jgi:predicted RNA binding protein YcfA (HicA-like mRNA interferase family)
MPKKIRELKAMLRKAGFISRPGKGSHTFWTHPMLTERISIAGKDGDDAQRYLEAEVRDLLKKLRELKDE